MAKGGRSHEWVWTTSDNLLRPSTSTDQRRGPAGQALLRWRERSRAVHADGKSRGKQHDGQVGALRRRCQLAAVDGPDLHPDAIMLPPGSAVTSIAHALKTR